VLRVVLAGDHGFVKAIFGDGERGELMADHELVVICGDGDDSSYLSSGSLVSVEYSLAVSVSLYRFGRILRS
jgi:hypothetical protein